MSGAWGWAGWMLVALLPLSFWALIIIFVVIVFGRDEQLAPQLDAIENDEPVTEPVRQPAASPSGLGWGPPVPSHH